jgi:MFS family permease
VALLAGICIRDTPEKMGLLRDGVPPETDESSTSASAVKEVSWNPIHAIRTKQFLLMTIAGIAYAVPWGVVVAHGRTHLSEQGFELSAIGVIMGSLALLSIIGRLSGILGDKINPRYVIIVGLILEGLGTIGFYFSTSYALTFASLIFIGIGFGSTYVCIPIIFSDFFGRAAFGTTAGTRVLITGIFNGLGPWLTGVVADETGSYMIPFLVLACLCAAGAFAVSICDHPGPPKSNVPPTESSA